MKKKIFTVLVLLLLTNALPTTTQAQVNRTGCYTCPATPDPDSCVFVGLPNAQGTCTQGSPVYVDSRTGQIISGTGVSNGLSYTPLEPIPGQTSKQPNFCELLNLLFKVLIYLGGMLAVLYLVLGGITYMVSEVVDKRSVARDRIKAAVVGLLILLGAYLILFTINPNLVNACNVLNGNTGGVVPSPSALDAQRRTELFLMGQACKVRVGRSFNTIPAGTDPKTLCQSCTTLLGYTSCSTIRSCGNGAFTSDCCDVIVQPTTNSEGAVCSAG